jgi:hypothetical protein
MISASRAIMSIAANAKYRKDENVRAIQKQTVNINLANHNPQTTARTYAVGAASGYAPVQTVPRYPEIASSPEIVERDVKLDVEEPAPIAEPPAAYKADPTFGGAVETAVSSDIYVPDNSPEGCGQLQDLHSMLNNYETVAQALILIIDLIQSNPLMINKLIVPTEESFRELLMILAGAEDIDVKYMDDVGCTLSSKKYRLVVDYEP